MQAPTQVVVVPHHLLRSPHIRANSSQVEDQLIQDKALRNPRTEEVHSLKVAAVTLGSNNR